MTAPKGFKTMADRRRDNPAAYTFETAKDVTAEAVAEAEAAAVPLAVILGGSGEPIARIHRPTGLELVFVPMSPTLRSLAAIRNGSVSIEGGEVEQMMALASQMLWLEEGDGVKRPATYDEIADSFGWEDQDLLGELLATYVTARVRRTAEGNA